MTGATTQIYVYLPDESVAVWRPVLAEHLEGDIYRILDQPYDMADERWEFGPGEKVICRMIDLYEGRVLAATASAVLPLQKR